MQSDEIRRHPDGSIDYDFYRARAGALRSQAMQDLLRKITLRRAALVLTAALAVAALAIVPAHISDMASAIRRVLEAAVEIG